MKLTINTDDKAVAASLRYGYAASPFGQMWIAWNVNESHHNICRLVFETESSDATEPVWNSNKRLKKSLRDDAGAAQLSNQLFKNDGVQPPSKMLLSITLEGTPFQYEVWQALLNIPDGTVVSYRQIALAIGRPTSVRAVVNAIGANPVAWLIPCHR